MTGPRSLLEIDTQFVAMTKAMVVSPARRAKKDMIQRFIPKLGCLNKDFQLVADLILTDIFM